MIFALAFLNNSKLQNHNQRYVPPSQWIIYSFSVQEYAVSGYSQEAVLLCKGMEKVGGNRNQVFVQKDINTFMS